MYRLLFSKVSFTPYAPLLLSLATFEDRDGYTGIFKTPRVIAFAFSSGTFGVAAGIPLIASSLPSSVITILSFLGRYCCTSAWKFSSGATICAPVASTTNVFGEAFSAPGFVGEPAIVPVVVGSHVFAFIGRKSIESRSSYDLPVVGDVYLGISNVLIVVALSTASFTG